MTDYYKCGLLHFDRLVVSEKGEFFNQDTGFPVSPDNQGYIKAYAERGSKVRRAAILAYAAFHGQDVPKGYKVGFKDLDETNFSYENLFAQKIFSPVGYRKLLNAPQAVKHKTHTKMGSGRSFR